nr:uncharacterized protein LOC131780953 isoform X1 [Pocillopora verrucosa]
MRLIRFYILFFISVVPVLVTVASTIQPRQPSATTTEGSSFLFEWDFHLQDEDEIELTGFIFGLWENGYTTFYLMTVTRQGRVISNPQLSKTHPTYVGRVTWVGNISKSYLAYKLVNLTFSDSNTYGCQIDVGGFRRTIHSKITLHVQAINASKTPEMSVSSIWNHAPNSTSSKFVPSLKAGVLENVTAGSVPTSNSNILVSHGRAGSAKSKWEIGVEYLSYLSVLAIPHFFRL